MAYYDNKTIFQIPKEHAELLKKFKSLDKDILFYYDIPLMFILSSDQHPNQKFLAYMFSSIDDEVLKYYILEKTTEEVEQYITQKIDLKTFLSNDLHNRLCFVEKVTAEKIEVIPLDGADLSHTLSLIKPELYYKGV